MATPMTPAQLRKALTAEGVAFREQKVAGVSWTDHDRNHKGPWGPVNGVVIHHTAGTDSLALVWLGIGTELPGPLAHAHLAKTGIVSLTSAGRANHAGTFTQNAHNAVLNETSPHPRPSGEETVDGNRHYYGIEIENKGNGTDPYPAVQYDQAVRWAAAICRFHGWTADSVIGHKEGTRRKIDPSFSMDTFRTNVAARLKHSAGWDPLPQAPAPLTLEQRVAKLEASVTRLEGQA